MFLTVQHGSGGASPTGERSLTRCFGKTSDGGGELSRLFFRSEEFISGQPAGKIAPFAGVHGMLRIDQSRPTELEPLQ